MNPMTGHLIAGQLYEELQRGAQQKSGTGRRVGDTLEAARAELARYEPVPMRLQADAERHLAGRSEAMVPKNDPLTRAMRKVRKQRQKAQKRARRANRR